jgi:hypothetical protein
MLKHYGDHKKGEREKKIQSKSKMTVKSIPGSRELQTLV